MGELRLFDNFPAPKSGTDVVAVNAWIIHSSVG
jgi:hypothetical protein